jgi:hypothetical protein
MACQLRDDQFQNYDAKTVARTAMDEFASTLSVIDG